MSANAGKNDDSCKLKKSLPEYAGTSMTDKDRGFWSTFYGRLLTPASLLAEYDANPTEHVSPFYLSPFPAVADSHIDFVVKLVSPEATSGSLTPNSPV